MTEVKFNEQQAFSHVCRCMCVNCTVINYYHHCYKLTVACHSHKLNDKKMKYLFNGEKFLLIEQMNHTHHHRLWCYWWQQIRFFHSLSLMPVKIFFSPYLSPDVWILTKEWNRKHFDFLKYCTTPCSAHFDSFMNTMASRTGSHIYFKTHNFEDCK